MITSLFNIEMLAWCPAVGLLLIALGCIYFFGMIVYAIYAEAHNLSMPLDTSYLIGKINGVIITILITGGLILFII